METASFSGTLRVIIIMVLAYYALKFLIRILAPILLQKAVQKAGQHMYEKQQEFNNAANRQQQAEPEKPREKKKIGEYIDFEEIE